MGRDELARGFWSSRRRYLAAWNRYEKLGTLSFTGAVMIIVISSADNAPAVAVLLTDWRGEEQNTQIDWKRCALTRPTLLTREHMPLQRLRSPTGENSKLLHPLLAQTPRTGVPVSPTTLPPANFPIQQNRGVNVPPVNRPEASRSSTPTPATPPATLPPAIFPSDRIPAVSVPPLQPIPSPTPTPITTSQPVNPLPERVSPAHRSSPAIEFGQPLPKATSADPKFSHSKFSH